MFKLGPFTKQLVSHADRGIQQPLKVASRFPRVCYTKQIVPKRYLTVSSASKSSAKANKSRDIQTQPKTFTWKSAVVLAMTAAGLLVYFKHEKERMLLEKAKRQREKIKALGKPNIGCQPFELYNVNTERRITSDQLLQGSFSLLYFGFTHCPDICPEELDKMVEVMEAIKNEQAHHQEQPKKKKTAATAAHRLQGIFITCDPLRDTADVVKEYVNDFHPDLIGLTGSAEELKKVARSYRVYSYVPPNVTVKDDYLVDHSIFIYLMDPQGQFVDCYSRDTTSEEIIDSVKDYMQDYNSFNKE
ncbi:SCO1/SenC-domain-containing protein [Mycotypha africana]|uniref:SCO1/SenC-domain-containing protein n=1 Tax=Mycotypha africana TaxID=64632 RepID=UPI0023007493|nr:SCO1/SenC-domain-containing protein [Mycotypha africana]KAI8979060.1 SCO1/SenC-domain-containing protein [Mycotypha africana]